MHQRYRTQGIFLKKQERGEADQLFTVITSDFGKIDVLGKAIRKITSKLRSGADIFYFAEIEFIQGKHHKTLTDALAIDKFDNIRKNHQRLEATQKIADVLDSFITKEEKDEKTWQLLLESFRSIENLEIENYLKIENCKLKIIYYYFLWNLLSILGYSPELYKCPVCDSKLLPETFFFVPQEGGVVCWRCFSSNGLKNGLWFNIHVDTVKILRVWLKDNWDLAGKLRIGTDAQRNLLEISDNYCSFLRG